MVAGSGRGDGGFPGGEPVSMGATASLPSEPMVPGAPVAGGAEASPPLALSSTRIDPRAGDSSVETTLPIEEFDGYRLVRRIGGGSMGAVFLAQDTVLDRPVAIKFVASVQLLPEARERFLREARAIARMHHANVVAVHRAGEVAGRPYLVSELVRGKSLDQVELPLPATELLSVALGITSGLAAAHRCGVLHRDLKPANVLRSQDGEVKLCDFGLAKLLDQAAEPVDESLVEALPVTASPDLTRPGAFMGTPRYLAPELWRRAPASVQSDLYALGAMLYHFATGQPPHTATDLPTLCVAVLSGPPPPLAEMGAQVDRRLALLVDRCLHPQAAMRPASADEVHAELLALAATAETATGENPYRGLHAFDAEHGALFFGRRREQLAVVELLRSQAFVVVAGDSGVGKSSLCQAAVMPMVTRGALRDGRAWSSLRMSPGRRPLVELARALVGFVIEVGERDEAALAAALRDDPDAVARRLCGVLGSQRGLLVLVDQLEELVTESEPAERGATAAALAALAAGIPGVRVLATARGDFLSRLAALSGLDRELSRAIYLLGPMDAAQRREVVAGPARVAGVRFESEALIETLVAAAGDGAAALPLLQFALAELWERRDQARAVITTAALDAIGGVAGALARHADGVLAAMTPSERRFARQLLTQLVTIEGTRACRSEADLVGEDAAAIGALRALVRGRLLAVHGDDDGRSAYEVAHEALLTGWTTLRAWLDRDAARRSVHERLAVAAAEWQRLGQARTALWGAPQLEEAARVELAPMLLAGREREFLEASLGAQRRQAWRRRALVLAAPLLVLALWGGLALAERVERSRAVAARLALARPELGVAATRAGESERLRGLAFTAFDAGRDDEGEALWSQALVARDQADKSFTRAAQPLETALQLDRARADVRDLLAETLYARALLAEKFHDHDRLAEALERLGWHDPDERWTARWTAAATLALRTVPAGARVQVQRYEQRDGRRVLGEAAELGTTPVEASLAPGSYLVVLSIEDRPPVRYPVLLARGERLGAEIAVPERVPDGYVYVPAGRFLYDSAEPTAIRAALRAGPQRPLELDGFLVARHEVSWEQWIEFVKAAPPGERTARLVKADSVRLDNPSGDRFSLWLRPSAVEYQADLGDPIVYGARVRLQRQDWRHFPVTGITSGDALAFTAWLDASGRLPGARLCTDREWERAARGADDRVYPHGDVVRGDEANVDITYGQQPGGFGPDEVGRHPGSESPFGVLDLTGNAWEHVSSAVEPGRFFIRGGSYYQNVMSGLATNREDTELGLRRHLVGMRVCASPSAI